MDEEERRERKARYESAYKEFGRLSLVAEFYNVVPAEVNKYIKVKELKKTQPGIGQRDLKRWLTRGEIKVIIQRLSGARIEDLLSDEAMNHYAQEYGFKREFDGGLKKESYIAIKEQLAEVYKAARYDQSIRLYSPDLIFTLPQKAIDDGSKPICDLKINLCDITNPFLRASMEQAREENKGQSD